MSCDKKEYLNKVYSVASGRVSDLSLAPSEAIRLIKVHTDDITVKLMEDFLNEFVDTNTNGISSVNKESTPIKINGIKLTNKGTLDVEVTYPDTNQEYTFRGLDIVTGENAKGMKVDAIEGLKDKLFDKDRLQVSGFTSGVSAASIMANQYASRVITRGSNVVYDVLSPKFQEAHRALLDKSTTYKSTFNLLSKGFENLDIIDDIKATLFVSGDINRKNLADLTTIADTVARRNYEILDTLLPKLDKRIEKNVEEEYRQDLDLVFGTSGFGAVFGIEGVFADLEAEVPIIDIVRNRIKPTKEETRDALEVKNFNTKRKIGTRNIQNAGINKKVAALSALLALRDNGGRGLEVFNYMKNNKKSIYNDLVELSDAVYSLNQKVNVGRSGGYLGNTEQRIYQGYDGHGTLDVFEDALEFRAIRESDLGKQQYSSDVWTVVREPKNGKLGIVSRSSTSTFIEGMGINKNRIMNGIQLDRTFVPENSRDVGKWLSDNNIASDDDNEYSRYRMILSDKEFEKAGGRKNIAHRLYRTFVHNKELIETQSAKDLIKDRMILSGEEDALQSLDSRIALNKDRSIDDKKELLPFIKTDLEWETVVRDYPNIAKRYKRAENISNFGGFDKQIKFVRKDMEAILVGHRQGPLIRDEYPKLQQWEKVYKQLVQLLKLKLVVANPAKLATDLLSNIGVLMSMDVNPIDAFKYGKEALELSAQMSKLEGRLVEAKVELEFAESSGRNVERAKARADRIDNQIKEHPYYDALKYGFIQSMGTSMIIKEFDTITGLQKTIDDTAKRIVETDGQKNFAHKAIVTWMNAGLGVNDVLDAVGNISAIKGTTFSDELLEISNRLKDKKQTEDTVRYISELIAAPSSEVVRLGSRSMQSFDAMTRWGLFQHTISKNVAEYKKANGRSPDEAALQKIKDDAGLLALDTFLDYRVNMPANIRLLSDYGILMFPSFWIRAQRVIFNLLKFHPLNAGIGYAVADQLGLGGASLIDANVVSKATSGSLVHPGQDVLDVDTFVLW